MHSNKGFSLVEIMIVGSIFIILSALASISILNVKQKTSLTASIATLVTDIKSQQLKSMIGDTEGRTNRDSYGIYFGTNQYTHFHGTYSAGDSTNLVVPLGDQIQFGNISFPSQQVAFAISSGEVIGATGTNTIVLQNTASGEQKTITVNKYGVVTGVQ